MNKDELLFKIAAVTVTLMSVVLFGVIFAVLFIGMPGWYVACYGIVYCIGAGYMAEKFIAPKIMNNVSESPQQEEVKEESADDGE